MRVKTLPIRSSGSMPTWVSRSGVGRFRRLGEGGVEESDEEARENTSEALSGESLRNDMSDVVGREKR